MNRLSCLALVGLLSLSFIAPAFAKTHAKPKSQQQQTDTSQQQQAASAQAATPANPDVPTPNAMPKAGPGALNVPVPPPPQLDAKSWVLMDYATGQILASANENDRVEPASITKVMTA
jgi:D-alanyl-D-alanine carboxypeptidase